MRKLVGITAALLLLAGLQALGWLWIVVGLVSAFAPFAFLVERLLVGDDLQRRPHSPR